MNWTKALDNPSDYVSGVEAEYLGVAITAERDGGQWRPTVDGDFYGSRTYLSSRDALAVARRVVDRRQGNAKPKADREELVDDKYWTAIREAVRNG